MIDVAATVEDNFRNALFHRTLCDLCADDLGGFDIAAIIGKPLVLRRSRGKRYTALVIDDLNIDVL